MADTRTSPGTFVWRELMTDDVDRARKFYGDLFGWTWKGEDMGPAGTYWMALRDGTQAAGLMARPPGMDAPTAWSSYVHVDDVDAAATRAATWGGKVLRPPADIPGVGRFAVIADPWGAVLLPFRSLGGEGPPPARPVPGAFCWETLLTHDIPGAIAFHRRVVGFGTGPTPDGAGTVFTAGGTAVADVQAAPPGGPSYWATYVAVADAAAARDRAAALGGRVLVPRVDVPKVGTVAVIADPTGAALGLFAPLPGS